MTPSLPLGAYQIPRYEHCKKGLTRLTKIGLQKTHTDYESLQQDRESPARYERLPRRRIEEVSEVEEVGEKLPRRRAEEVDERLPRMRDREESTSGQSSR